MGKRKINGTYQYTLFHYHGEPIPIPELWWRNNGHHYTRVAAITAPCIEDAYAVTRHHHGSVWYRRAGVTLQVSVPVRESRDGDILLLSEGQDRGHRQTWIILSDSPTAIIPPVKEPIQREKQQRPVFAVGWSPDSRFFAVGGGQGLVRIHPLESLRYASYDTHGGYVQSLAWSPDGKRVATGDSYHATHVWDVANSGECVGPSGRILICRDHQACMSYKEGTYAVAWAPDGTVVAAGSSQGQIALWNAETGACVYRYQPYQDAVRALAWSPGGAYLASVSEGGGMQILDRYEQTRRVYPSLAPLRALAWSPDGRELLVGGEAQPVLFVYDALGRRKDEIMLSRFAGQGGIQSIAYAPEGDYAVAGCTDGSIQIVDTITGEHMHTYHGHQAPVYSVAWSPDGAHILSGSEDTYVFVWLVPQAIQKSIHVFDGGDNA